MIEKKPILTSFTCGSATPFKGKHPSFNVAYLDSETLLPVDFETHYMNIEKANMLDRPEWELLYNYKETLNIKDLSP
jgi:Acid sphingomyelin phosphodiesterase C-terminal region